MSKVTVQARAFRVLESVKVGADDAFVEELPN